MEKNEILDQTGITFRGLFLVFKKIWYWLLVIVILCGTGYTLLDSYQNRNKKNTYYSHARLVVQGVSYSDLEKTYDRLSSYLYLPILVEDVENKQIQKKASPNIKDKYDYVGKDDPDFDYDNMINYYGGSIYLAPSSNEYFIIHYESYTMTPEQVQATLNQICKSLINVLGASWIIEDGMQSTASSIYEGNVIVEKEADLPGPPRAYKNIKAPVIGVFFGLIISAVIVVMIYKLDDSIKSKEELERITGVIFITFIEDIGDVRDKGEIE